MLKFYERGFSDVMFDLVRESGSTGVLCQHCGLPEEKRINVERRLLKRIDPGLLFMMWFVSTVQQSLYRYFLDSGYIKWCERFDGGFPLLVEQAGLGCVRVMRPKKILSLISEHDFSSQYKKEISYLLDYAVLGVAKLETGEFLEAIRNDRDIEEDWFSECRR